MTKPFDRVIINPLERPLSVDYRQQASNFHRSLMTIGEALVRAMFGASPAPGAIFFSNAFTVTAPGGSLNITLNPGLGFNIDSGDTPAIIDGLPGEDDVSIYHPLPLSVVQPITVPTPDPSNPRIDIIEVATDRRGEQPQSRDFLDVGTGAITAASVNKVLAYYLDGRIGNFGTGASTTGIGYKKGTPAGVPVAPATTAGYTVVARILVPAASASIIQADVTDMRRVIDLDNRLSLAETSIISLQSTRQANEGSVVSTSSDDLTLVAPVLHTVTPGVFLDLNLTGGDTTVGAFVTLGASGLMTFVAGGLYMVNFSVGIGTPDPTVVQTYPATVSARVVKNGADIRFGSNGLTMGKNGGFEHFGILSGSKLVRLAAGDTLRLQGTNGAAAVANNLSLNSWSFSAHRIAP